MCIIVTGAAGFIGFHTSLALLSRGERVVGVDNLNSYYSPELKRARLAKLTEHNDFIFEHVELADKGALHAVVERHPEVDRVIHLAAQAGVRYSLTNPHAYLRSNIDGHLEVLETCRAMRNIRHLVYASSSSVYGGNTKLPFSVEDRVDTPQSLYAATKKADELMSYCYSHLYGIPTTGLRFFTVYGPWGRPDMAAWLFTEAMLKGEPIKLFNRGEMERDFTYIDDIVTGVVACLDHPASGAPPCRIYNVGNHRSEKLSHFVEVLERALGCRAKKEMLPMQPGDVAATYADIQAIQGDLGFCPTTSIEEGLPLFVAWYRQYHGL